MWLGYHIIVPYILIIAIVLLLAEPESYGISENTESYCALGKNYVGTLDCNGRR